MGRRLARFTAPFERRLWPGAPVILMYHRVAEPDRDPWSLAVGAERFAEQIQALQGVRRVLPLGELVKRLREGTASDEPLAAVTFDDGYLDVFEAARPILHRFDCPATVFVATGMVDSSKEFWWDELERIVLASPMLPPSLTRALDPNPEARMRLCLRLRRALRHLPPAEIDRRLAALGGEIGLERRARPAFRTMTSGQVAGLSDGLITVGAHTINHPSLPHLTAAEQQVEIGQSRRACEAMVGAPVEHFAYPFGYFDDPSVNAVRRAGFVSACTTVASVAHPRTDPLRLPRMHAGRRTPDALLKRLAGG